LLFYRNNRYFSSREKRHNDVSIPGLNRLQKGENKRGDVYNWGALMAGALCASVPVALVYSFFVEHCVAGMTGALKE
jgi:ABC-type glycerol-3-phosphate transport system permease component